MMYNHYIRKQDNNKHKDFKMTDLTYTIKGLFTTFIPQSEAGEKAWREIEKFDSSGTATVLTIQLKQVLAQLKKAGYSVKKSKKATKKEIDALYKELTEMGM